VAQFLRRWWYALPPWPPEDWNPSAALLARKLKVVDIEEWDDTEDVDEEGFTKVYQLSQFRGVFRDPYGTAHDLRPREGCPCYSNFVKKSDEELYKLIITAATNQMKILEKSVYDERELLKSLQEEIVEATAALDRATRRRANDALYARPQLNPL